MDWTTFQNVLADWFASVTGLTVRWAPSNVERPTYPYGELSILSDGSVGQDSIDYILDPDTLLLTPQQTGLREVVVTCKVTTNANTPAKHARSYTSKLRSALRQPSTIELFSANKIAIVNASATVAFDNTRNLGIVSVAAFDLRLATTISETDTTTTFLQTAEVEGTIFTPDPINFGPDTYGDV